MVKLLNKIAQKQLKSVIFGGIMLKLFQQCDFTIKIYAVWLNFQLTFVNLWWPFFLYSLGRHVSTYQQQKYLSNDQYTTFNSLILTQHALVMVNTAIITLLAQSLYSWRFNHTTYFDDKITLLKQFLIIIPALITDFNCFSASLFNNINIYFITSSCV
jgi:hypothetical protein